MFILYCIRNYIYLYDHTDEKFTIIENSIFKFYITIKY